MRPGRILISCSAVLIAAGLAYLSLLAFPSALFPYHLSRNNLHLFSDRPIPAPASSVLDSARLRLARSPWYDTTRAHRVFVCQTRWRWKLFTLHKHKVAAINCVFLGRNVFMRQVDWGENRLIGPSGKPTTGDRTLPYFFAHEIAHGITVDRIGWRRYWNLEAWKREGYADYLGKPDWDFPAMLAKFQAGDPIMEPEGSGHYSRYHLLMRYRLLFRGEDVDHVFADPLPAAAIEAELRALHPDQVP